jgi:hypothetical protein
MISVLLIETPTSEHLGKFKFSVLPRVGEKISIASPGIVQRTLNFRTDKVWHIAEGAKKPHEHGGGPATIVYVTEET